MFASKKCNKNNYLQIIFLLISLLLLLLLLLLLFLRPQDNKTNFFGSIDWFASSSSSSTSSSAPETSSLSSSSPLTRNRWTEKRKKKIEKATSQIPLRGRHRRKRFIPLMFMSPKDFLLLLGSMVLGIINCFCNPFSFLRGEETAKKLVRYLLHATAYTSLLGLAAASLFAGLGFGRTLSGSVSVRRNVAPLLPDVQELAPGPSSPLDQPQRVIERQSTRFTWSACMQIVQQKSATLLPLFLVLHIAALVYAYSRIQSHKNLNRKSSKTQIGANKRQKSIRKKCVLQQTGGSKSKIKIKKR